MIDKLKHLLHCKSDIIWSLDKIISKGKDWVVTHKGVCSKCNTTYEASSTFFKKGAMDHIKGLEGVGYTKQEMKDHIESDEYKYQVINKSIEEK